MDTTGQHERDLAQALYDLVRELYRRKQAEDIIASFENVFASHESESERLSIIEYWLDFYRLRKYRRAKQRRRPTYRERVTACSACGYPVSHRHHLWDVALHGENKVTIQLCANCHELHHLMYNALARDSAYSRKLVWHVLASPNVSPGTAQMVLDWCRATIQYEADNGWIEAYRASDEWLEQRLKWSAYLKQVGASAG